MYTPPTFYEAISPTVTTSMLCGILPFHIVHEYGKYCFKITNTERTLSITYALLFSGFVVNASLSPDNFIIFNYYQNIVSNLGLVTELVGGVSLLYLIYFYNVIFAEEICDTFIKCYKVDQSIIQFGCDLRYKYLFYHQILEILSGVITFMITGGVQYMNAQSSGFGKLTFSLRVVLIFPMAIIFLMETQYTLLTILLRFRFQNINDELQEMQKGGPVFTTNEGLKRIEVGPILRGLATKTIEYASPSPLKRLETLMTIHDSLCDIVEQVNGYYGLLILISIGIKFLVSVFCIYYCYWSQVVKNRTSSSIIWFAWACYNLYALINLAINCQKAYTQAKETGFYVHKLLLSTCNPSIREKLSIFSQQLMHRKVSFTALELFSIDATLLLSILGTGATYLIIMLQFQEKSEEKPEIIMFNSTHTVEAS